MPKLKGTSKPERNPDHYGAIYPDGSYDPEAPLSARGPTDRFVRAMIKSRKGPGFPPELASQAIELANMTLAFPNWKQWRGEYPPHLLNLPPPTWPLVWTNTSAEEAVKRCGLGVMGDRHWCGEQWVLGLEKNCDSPGHRTEKDQAKVAELISRIGS